MGDRSEYTDTGMRGKDGREGFGDDMGTRVGRPDGAREAPREAPREAGTGGQRAGQPGTNEDAVADGIEGSIMDRDAGQARGSQDRDPDSTAGPEQARVQAASESVNRPAGDNRRIDDL